MITCGVCESEDKECGSHCFYQELKVKALKALYEKTCAEVKNFGEISGKGLGKNSFADHRHEEEPAFDFDTMLKTLKNKQIQLEGVINDHLIFLHGEGSLSNFSELTFDQKLDYIDKHEVELQTGKPKKKDQDEETKDAAEKRERLRLQGVTMSYDLYESQNFNKYKEVQ